MKTKIIISGIACAMVAFLGGCRQHGASPDAKQNTLSDYLGTYIVGRMTTDNGSGMDPIDFRVVVLRDRLEWTKGTNRVTVSFIVSSRLADATTVDVTLANDNVLRIAKIQNGISIRDQAEGKMLFCQKQKPEKPN